MGTSLLVLCQVYPVWDHPHAYGDKALLLSKTNSHQGSSPRVWGQVTVATATEVSTKDHPHAYGDKQSL